MPAYTYRDRTLYCEGVALAEIAARAGTPCYVYSAATVLENFRAYDDAFGDLHSCSPSGQRKSIRAAIACQPARVQRCVRGRRLYLFESRR
jgi:hypothetical protein